MQTWVNANIIIICPTGKLQKAEYILSSLINNSGTTGSFLSVPFHGHLLRIKLSPQSKQIMCLYLLCAGHWIYHSESDRVLVQAVSVQVRGTILQKLGKITFVKWKIIVIILWLFFIVFVLCFRPVVRGCRANMGFLGWVLLASSTWQKGTTDNTIIWLP